MLVVRASHARQFTLHTRRLVGGTSIACPTIYTTYTVFGYTPDNLLYKHGSHCQLDEQPGSRVASDGQQQRQTEEEKRKGLLILLNINEFPGLAFSIALIV